MDLPTINGIKFSLSNDDANPGQFEIAADYSELAKKAALLLDQDADDLVEKLSGNWAYAKKTAESILKNLQCAAENNHYKFHSESASPAPEPLEMLAGSPIGCSGITLVHKEPGKGNIENLEHILEPLLKNNLGRTPEVPPSSKKHAYDSDLLKALQRRGGSGKDFRQK